MEDFGSSDVIFWILKKIVRMHCIRSKDFIFMHAFDVCYNCGGGTFCLSQCMVNCNQITTPTN
jgi:hypothetical protein